MSATIAIRPVWILGETSEDEGHYEYKCDGCGDGWDDQIDVPDVHECPPFVTYRSSCGEASLSQIPWETLNATKTAIYAAGFSALTWNEHQGHGMPTHLGFRVRLDRLPSPIPGAATLGGQMFYVQHTPSTPPTGGCDEPWEVPTQPDPEA